MNYSVMLQRAKSGYREHQGERKQPASFAAKETTSLLLPPLQASHILSIHPWTNMNLDRHRKEFLRRCHFKGEIMKKLLLRERVNIL